MNDVCLYYQEKLKALAAYTQGKSLSSFWRLEEKLSFSSEISLSPRVMFSIPIEEEWKNKEIEIWVELSAEKENIFGKISFTWDCFQQEVAMFPSLAKRQNIESYQEGNKTSLVPVCFFDCVRGSGYFLNCSLARYDYADEFLCTAVVIHTVLLLLPT